MGDSLQIDHNASGSSGECGILIAYAPSGSDQLHAELQQTLFDFAAFKLKACNAFVSEADASLASGNGPAAQQAFQNGEQAFESVQRCLSRMECEDLRNQTEAMLHDIGIKLDGLWVKLISGGCPSL